VAYLRISEQEACLILLNLGSDAVTDLSLNLAESGLRGKYGLQVIMGGGAGTGLSTNGSGGFTDYKPVSAIAGHGTIIFILNPEK
jgi:hypothetical protein